MSNTPALTKEQIKETRDLCLGLISGIPVGYAVREKADQCFALALSTLTPTASGDGSERPKRPMEIDLGNFHGESADHQERLWFKDWVRYGKALEAYATKLEAERDQFKASLKSAWLSFHRENHADR